MRNKTEYQNINISLCLLKNYFYMDVISIWNQ